MSAKAKPILAQLAAAQPKPGARSKSGKPVIRPSLMNGVFGRWQHEDHVRVNLYRSYVEKAIKRRLKPGSVNPGILREVDLITAYVLSPQRVDPGLVRNCCVSSTSRTRNAAPVLVVGDQAVLTLTAASAFHLAHLFAINPHHFAEVLLVVSRAVRKAARSTEIKVAELMSPGDWDLPAELLVKKYEQHAGGMTDSSVENARRRYREANARGISEKNRSKS